MDRTARVADEPFDFEPILVVGMHPLMSGGAATGTSLLVLQLPNERVDAVLFGPQRFAGFRPGAA